MKQTKSGHECSVALDSVSCVAEGSPITHTRPRAPNTDGHHAWGSGVSEAVNRDERSNPTRIWELVSASARSLEVGA
jgi:hypothetical protein